MPSSIRIDHAVLHALNNNPIPGLPATIRIQLHIASVTSKISTALGECETSATGLTSDPLPLVRVFETELNMIQDRYAGEWSPSEEVSFLDARLSLYSYVVDQMNSHQEIITQSSITARQLLIVVTTFPEILRKGVFHVFRAASYAAFFLLRILKTAPSQCIDEADIKNTIRQTFTLIRDISQTGNDGRFYCYRVCRIIEHMIGYEDWNTDMPFTGKAESFMSNNFIADVAARGILRARQAAQMERDCEVQADINDLNFSSWDPLEWTVDWHSIDDLLIPATIE